MEEDIRIELFTAADIKEWLIHNNQPRGLLDKVVSKQRAWSLVHNPYVQDTSPLLSVIFVNDEVAAYNAVFPEQMERPCRNVVWNSMLYVAPHFEGRGYGALVIGNILEQYDCGLFDHAAAPASVENFKFLGQSVSYVSQYIFSNKHVRANNIRGVLAKIKNDAELSIISRYWSKHSRRIERLNYHLEYVSYVDDALYTFIREHSVGDVFLRTQQSFNWMLHYPFSMWTPLHHRVRRDNQFSSAEALYQYVAVKMLVDNQLVGFYVLSQRGTEMVVKYLYVDSLFESIVFDSIVEHLLIGRPHQVITYNKSLSTYIKSMHLYQRITTYPTSFVYPSDFCYGSNQTIQAGDGDMFS